MPPPPPAATGTDEPARARLPASSPAKTRPKGSARLPAPVSVAASSDREAAPTARTVASIGARIRSMPLAVVGAGHRLGWLAELRHGTRHRSFPSRAQ